MEVARFAAEAREWLAEAARIRKDPKDLYAPYTETNSRVRSDRVAS